MVPYSVTYDDTSFDRYTGDDTAAIKKRFGIHDRHLYFVLDVGSFRTPNLNTRWLAIF